MTTTTIPMDSLVDGNAIFAQFERDAKGHIPDFAKIIGADGDVRTSEYVMHLVSALRVMLACATLQNIPIPEPTAGQQVYIDYAKRLKSQKDYMDEKLLLIDSVLGSMQDAGKAKIASVELEREIQEIMEEESCTRGQANTIYNERYAD